MKSCRPFKTAGSRSGFANLTRNTALALIAVGITLGTPPRAAAEDVRFDVNDISFLWPVALNKEDLAKLIPIDQKLSADAPPLLSPDIFQSLMAMAKARAVSVKGDGNLVQMLLPDNSPLLQASNWKVVGIRIDPSAIGVDDETTKLFGSHPQIRVVTQPVLVDANGKAQVQDFTIHLAFDFTLPSDAPTGPIPKGIPDKVRFRAILDHLTKIKALVQAANVKTEVPLGVHPGLKANVAGLNKELRLLLAQNVSRERLVALAMMGVRNPEPWIFFTVFKQPDGTFAPLPGGTPPQMFAFGGAHVVPVPSNRNFGQVSTALVFNETGSGGLDLSASQLDSPIPSHASAPNQLPVKLRDIPDIIANPKLSNLFTTDCVSCHTESSRRISPGMQNPNPSLAYQRPAGISGVDPDMLPKAVHKNWNVRNFGWFPNFVFENGKTYATVTQRVANEAADCADYINHEYFGQAKKAPEPVPVAVVAAPAPPPADVSVSHGLTLIMKIKGPTDLQALAALLDPKVPANQDEKKITQDRITTAMNKIGTVHFARFVIRSEQMELMVITNFDGSFPLYIDAFTDAIGDIFDQLLAHTADGAALIPVSANEEAFLKYVQDHDASFDKATNSPRPSYSAYPNLKVQDILTLQKRASDAAPLK